jgi:hypothetical protein
VLHRDVVDEVAGLDVIGAVEDDLWGGGEKFFDVAGVDVGDDGKQLDG